MRTPRSALAQLAALLAGIASAQAQPADTVTVGQETKNAFGTILEMQNGDIACNLTLKDDRGRTFRELADFPICQRKAALLNKRVALSYKLQPTQSPECQGDPHCKKSVMVALVSDARPAGATPATTTAATARTSHCTATEDVVFSCRNAQKMVSVCASKDAAATRGTLEYRFGDVAHDKPLEMKLPRDKTVPSKAANGATDAFSGGGGAWLSFAQGQYVNTVYTGIGKWGPRGETRQKAGLVVERDGRQISVMRCTGKPTSELGPDLFEKLGITAGDRTFDYPD
ncbi:MAG: hypothetical protein JSR24_14910 [Proteobacteria bacterium]|nr:hypothetical protein [Pseudomonadota bacterium]